MIDPIVNRNFGNNFHHHNSTNQHQHVHTHTGKNYQSTSSETSRSLSPQNLKEKYFGCTISGDHCLSRKSK